MAYSTSNTYKSVIYSSDARHKVKIWFNGTELVDADRYCEKIVRTSRILPNDGAKRFSIDNFVSQEIDLILNKVNTSIIQDQVQISLGTLVDSANNTYEYVPFGIFNIQGTPTSDKDKITIKLRDNRVKFDFGYNAKPLIDAGGGRATKKQILTDICNKANVICDTTTFLGENDEIGVYDNSITATTYVSYIAEQAGMIATITREGHLLFVNLNNLVTHKIPLSIVEKYELGDNYTIQRVAYESGIIKYETSNDKTLDTLYINTANPYISTQTQIDNIFNIVGNFEIDSVTTGRILGDPAIDPYDLIEVYGYYDENNHFVNDENTIVFKTLANQTMTYNGKIVSVFDTQIGLEERKENVTINGEATYRKYAKAEYDNANAQISLIAGEVTQQNNKIASLTLSVDDLESKIQDIADITISGESSYATFTLDNVNASEPIQIIVRPLSENISYLYPTNGLFPSDSTYLKVRTIRFENLTTSEIIDYELPNDLLYYDSETYDEFYLNYDSQTCQVIQRCDYNADGTVKKLTSENVINYPYPTIELTDGDYRMTLLGYSNAYLQVRLMAKNIYTSQFYTKAETETRINQTAESINLSVDTKLSNYATTEQLTSQINITNQSISSEVTRATTNENTLSSRIAQTAKTIDLTVSDNNTSAGINIKLKNEDGDEIDSKSANITMSGLVKFTDLSTSGSTTINGSNITTGTISANRVDLSGYLTVSSASSTYASKSSLSAGTTTINGGCITTGVIKSSNYVSGSTGTSINLSTGVIDTKNFKVSSTGTITATGGTIGGWNLYSTNFQKQIGEYSFEIRSDRAYNEPAMLIYKNQGSNQGYKWYVRPDGYMYSTNAYIQGTIQSSAVNGSTITGGSININNYFSVNTSGGAQLSTSNGGFLTTRTTSHPYVSALNIASNSGGIAFLNGTTQDSPGSGVAGIYQTQAGVLNEWANSNININSGSNIAITSALSSSNYVRANDIYFCGNDTYNWVSFGGTAAQGLARIRSDNANINLYTQQGGYVFVNGSNYNAMVVTNGGSPSSLNVKKNLKRIDDEYDAIYEELKQVHNYNYDYKYQYANKGLDSDYGFIIDEIENTKHLSKYFRNFDEERWIDGNKLIRQNEDEDMSKYEKIDIKEWDKEGYIKGLFVLIKALQNKIDKLEKEVLENE